MELITSRNNQKIIDATKLSDKKYRDNTGCFFFEGVKLYDEALLNNVKLESVFFRSDCISYASELPRTSLSYEVNSSVYEKLTDEKSPQGIFCIAKHLDNLHKFATIYVGGSDERCFLVYGVRDPGNMGTILRTAAAMNIHTVIMSQDCADIYNPKTIRAGMGAIFRQNTVRVSDFIGTVEALKDVGKRVYAAALNKNSIDLRDIDHFGSACFIVGNEGHGIPDDVIDVCTSSVIIPMLEGSESLNVASASSILMWEYSKNLL